MRRKTLALLVGGVALVVPAAVVIGGSGNQPIETDIATSGGQTVWSTDGPTGTRSRTYKTISGLPRWSDALLAYDPGTEVQITVDLRGGKANVRLRDGDNPAAIFPGSILMTGKGVSTATFVVRSGFLNDPFFEWKRVGRPKVEARSIVVSVAGPFD